MRTCTILILASVLSAGLGHASPVPWGKELSQADLDDAALRELLTETQSSSLFGMYQVAAEQEEELSASSPAASPSASQPSSKAPIRAYTAIVELPGSETTHSGAMSVQTGSPSTTSPTATPMTTTTPPTSSAPVAPTSSLLSLTPTTIAPIHSAL
jgi:hypothetical protein